MFVKSNISGPYVPLHVLGLYQEGGDVMPMEEPAPAEGQGNPMEEIVMIAMQAVQEQNPDLAMQACQMLVEFVQGQGGGQEAPPAEAPVEQPAMKSGGKVKPYEYGYDFNDEEEFLG